MIQLAQIVEDSEGRRLYLAGGQIAYRVDGNGAGMGLRDLLAYVRGDTAGWTVEEVTGEVIGEVVAEWSAGVQWRWHQQQVIIYPGKMGRKAQEYILGGRQNGARTRSG